MLSKHRFSLYEYFLKSQNFTLWLFWESVNAITFLLISLPIGITRNLILHSWTKLLLSLIGSTESCLSISIFLYILSEQITLLILLWCNDRLIFEKAITKANIESFMVWKNGVILSLFICRTYVMYEFFIHFTLTYVLSRYTKKLKINSYSNF